MKHILGVLVLSFPLFSYAVKWVERGNGGFILKCDTGTHQTLDIYEAQQRSDDLDMAHLESVDGRVEYLIQKIERINPSRAELYRNWHATFMSESQFLANVELSPVPDIGLGVRPKNCTYQLAIFQREPGILNSKRYIVSLDLWNELDVLNKAALVMHELIYRELIEFYPIHQTSESTRYLNGALNSLLFDRLSVKEYISLLQTLRFPRADLNGFTIRLSAGNNRSEWRPFKFQLLPNGEFAFALLEDRGVILPLNNKHLSCLTESVAVYFHPNGKPAEVDSYMRGYLNCAKNYIYSEDKTRIEVIDQKWRFDQNGVLIAMIGTVDFGSNSASLTLDGYSLVPQIIRSYDKTTKVELQFSSSGKLSKLTIHEPSTLCRTKNSKEITFVLTPFAGFVQLRPETFRETLAKIPDCEYK